MILRLDRIATELPPPSDPDPAGAAAVQDTRRGLDLNVSEELALEALFYRLARTA